MKSIQQLKYEFALLVNSVSREREAEKLLHHATQSPFVRFQASKRRSKNLTANSRPSQKIKSSSNNFDV